MGPCVPTVLLGGLPAAVLGDMLICVGPPDTIAKGSATVLIGGKPAARMGDSTAHGGVIVAGCLEGGCHFLEGNLRARRRVVHGSSAPANDGFAPRGVWVIRAA